MKRTPLKRGTSKLRRTPLRGGKVALARTRMNTIGKRKKRELAASKEFAHKPLEPYYMDCECCLKQHAQTHIQAHHMCSRAQGAGHPNLHDKRNRAWLCIQCHDDVHRGLYPEFIKPTSYLNTL